MNVSADAGVTVCTAARAVRSPIDSVQVSPGSLVGVSLLVADWRTQEPILLGMLSPARPRMG